MMDSIRFKACYGDFNSDVLLTRFGNGTHWDISIDRYFKGCVVFWDGKWEVRPHKPEYFELEDMQEISYRITEFKDQLKKEKLCARDIP